MNHQPAFVHSWGVSEQATATVAVPSWLAPKMPERPSARIPTGMSARPPVQMSEEHVAPAPAHPSEVSLAESALRPPRTPVIVAPDFDPEPPPPAYPDLREENGALKMELAELGRMMARLRREVLDASEAELVRLAGAIAERVVGRELSTDPSLMVGWAKEGIAALDATDGLVVAVSSDIAAAIPEEAWAAANPAGEPLRVETDPSLPMSKCEIRTRTGSVDFSATGRMTSVARELGGHE